MKIDPFMGDVKLHRDSSLRKLARAMRRDKVPPEIQFKIDQATASANRRYLEFYQHRGKRRL